MTWSMFLFLLILTFCSLKFWYILYMLYIVCIYCIYGNIYIYLESPLHCLFSRWARFLSESQNLENHKIVHCPSVSSYFIRFGIFINGGGHLVESCPKFCLTLFHVTHHPLLMHLCIIAWMHACCSTVFQADNTAWTAAKYRRKTRFSHVWKATLLENLEAHPITIFCYTARRWLGDLLGVHHFQ